MTEKTGKSFVSASWFCRVDGDENVLRPKVIEFSSKLDCVKMLSVHHTGKKKENPHAHFVITISNPVQKQSFAIRVKNHFAVVDRGYALTPWDGEHMGKCVTYMFHEDEAPVLVHKGWTEAEVAELRGLGKTVSEAVKESLEKASQKLVERALLKFQDQPRRPEKFDILFFMLQEIHQKKAYHPGEFKLKTFVEEVFIKLTPADRLEEVAWQLYNNLWR